MLQVVCSASESLTDETKQEFEVKETAKGLSLPVLEISPQTTSEGSSISNPEADVLTPTISISDVPLPLLQPEKGSNDESLTSPVSTTDAEEFFSAVDENTTDNSSSGDTSKCDSPDSDCVSLNGTAVLPDHQSFINNDKQKNK